MWCWLVSEPWPGGVNANDPQTLFPYLMAMTFDGVVEIVVSETVNYLVFHNGTVARAYMATAHQGSLVERVTKLFMRDAKQELRIARWGMPGPLPIQAPPALIQAYRDLSGALVQRLVDHGRDSAPAIAEHARQNLVAAHPVLDGFSLTGKPAREPLDEQSPDPGARRNVGGRHPLPRRARRRPRRPAPLTARWV